MIFRTERLLLRPWTLGDGELLAELSQDEGFRSFSLFEPMEADAAREFLRVRLERCRDGFGLWAVLEDDRIIGNFQLFQQTLDDRPGEWPEIGYRLRSSAWGRGLATEGSRALMAYAHGALRIETLFAFIDPTNLRSQSVARKLTFSPGESARFKGFDIELWRHQG